MLRNLALPSLALINSRARKRELTPNLKSVVSKKLARPNHIHNSPRKAICPLQKPKSLQVEEKNSIEHQRGTARSPNSYSRPILHLNCTFHNALHPALAYWG